MMADIIVVIAKTMVKTNPNMIVENLTAEPTIVIIVKGIETMQV